ncbi:MAG: Replication protein, partial [Euryarchaeota archaeon]|nr:Replication protein [Euryarchaeota archaeon]
ALPICKGQSPQKASKELAKYVVKPGDFLQDPSLVDEYLKAVKGSRLVSTFGVYYNMVLDDDDDDCCLPDCWCGKNEWRRLDVFYSIADVFKDTQGFYRMRTIISDG